jgi:hypothetical protein
MKLGHALSLGVLLSSSLALGQGIGPITTQVPNANQRLGHPGTKIDSGFRTKVLAKGSDALENPSGSITNFGLLSDGTLTEPDQNTYLVFSANPGGPASGFDYGRHFVFQGHENGGDLGYVTRINLDVTDPAHRITLLTPPGSDGLTHFNSTDGSTYDPFTNTLLFTEEDGTSGGVFQVTTSWPPVVTTLYGILGQGGFEGIHPDDQGNILLIEDAGGVTVNVNPHDPNSPKVAKQPNSFLYRFVPYDKTNLSAGGKLQALQVKIDGVPVIFHATEPVGDTFSTAQLKLHTLGTSYPVQWVTLHDTAVDGSTPFDANAAAKAALATPFKRPENAQFAPGSNYQTFYFDPTGDTDSLSGNTPALAQRGAWGSIFRVDLNADRQAGTISIFFLGDSVHNSFDNLTFADDHTLLAAEDRGDTLHAELNTLDSVWAFSTNGSEPTLRFVALGRDKVSEVAGEDNEPTGLHVSNGSMDLASQPGTEENLVGARGFLTRQHGENVVWEITKTN